MALILDPSGVCLLDSTSAATLAVSYGEDIVARAVACVSGNVVTLALGFGSVRQALLTKLDASEIASVRTFEPSADVIGRYDAAYVPDAGNVVEQAIVDAVHDKATETPGDTDPWDSLVIELSGGSLPEDPGFLDDLRAIFPDPGGRVIILAERDDLQIFGFAGPTPETFGDAQFLYIFDRFDPDNGIGVANPFGTVLVPGFGWE